MVDYRRNLPHWFPQGRRIFHTWRLYGSLPTASWAHRDAESELPAGERFRLADQRLDRAQFGPLWLKEPQVAQCVVDGIERGASKLGHYQLHAFVVMPNHVHVLLSPQVEVRKLMNALKGVTARAANSVLGRTGKHFWQDESFDHWVRDETQFARVKNYIERNPVTARLVTKPEDWPWSSAHHKQVSPDLAIGRTLHSTKQ